ncbi:MAG: hypothetical protein GF400_09505 [Candidatus Eisenbacteria bacterium]|nr:hypothetical protein [Candidatus Eisenbacteria bacterium]
MRRLLVALCILTAAVGCASEGDRTESSGGADSDGHTRRGAAESAGHVPGAAGDSLALTEEQREELERIGTLGYMAAGEPGHEESGLTVNEPGAWPGYTVYVSADFPGAFLVDMDGRILHTWSEEEAEYWTRARVYPDGSILGVTAYPGRLVKLGWDSRFVWGYGGKKLRAHHDVRVADDGRIYVLMRVGTVLEWLRESPLLVDLVCVLEPEGELVRQVACIPIPEAFRDSEYAYMLESPVLGSGEDPFHTNSVELLHGRVEHPAFREGNVLVTIRNMDCLAVLDLDEERAVWANRGRWQRQHEARVTPDGTLMLFDNRKFETRSRIVEYDVVEDRIVWSYTEPGFFTKGTGAQQLLPNDNVLITESESGRVFEITRDGGVVWEYWNPRRVDDGAIARLTRAFRLPLDYFNGEFAERIERLRQTGS